MSTDEQTEWTRKAIALVTAVNQPDGSVGARPFVELAREFSDGTEMGLFNLMFGLSNLASILAVACEEKTGIDPFTQLRRVSLWMDDETHPIL